MAKKLLIDASHSEEIRVAVVCDKNLEEFDSETVHKKILKGNIYLAKVMRVEPSLQAAFVEYGNGRQGFLPFSEIHPDYYQIPVADREAILQSEHYKVPESYDTSPEGEPLLSDSIEPIGEIEETHHFENDNFDELASERIIESSIVDSIGESIEEDPSLIEQLIIQELDESIENELSEQQNPDTKEKPRVRGRRRFHKKDDSDESKPSTPRPYQYKIQEVIKRRQILLVQVIKEERGNKGAAVTTYLSLAGRYCVLMPNAGRRNGGVSKKIDDTTDRTRLKDIINSLNIPEGMSLIIRTAGQERRKMDIKRDYEYLVSVWNKIREKTLQSIAPALIHEEGNLIIRALRDMYDIDIDEILVEGDEAYKTAKNIMKMMMPSHSKRVQHYKNPMLPLFHAYHVEQQMDNVMNPVCPLPSGGYIVLSITEALVAIDVNSGKATKERHIDETALKTNLEAADQIARQLRLRDLSGLVVVDFIDMHDSKHIQQVERRFREALKNDRARLQIGRISQFGLLEMSRQRLRPSLMENHAMQCAHCHGSGYVRSIESCSLQILRAIEGEAVRGGVQELLVQTPPHIDLYLLNNKRNQLVHIESRFHLKITIERDSELIAPMFNIDVLKGNLFDVTQTEMIEEELIQEEIVPAKEKNTDFKNKKNHQNKAKHEKLLNKQQEESPVEDETPVEQNLESKEVGSVENEGNSDRKRPHHRHNRFRNKRHRFNKDEKREGQQGNDGSSSEGSTPAPVISQDVKVKDSGTPKEQSPKEAKQPKEASSKAMPLKEQKVKDEQSKSENIVSIKEGSKKSDQPAVSDTPEKKVSKQKKPKSWLRRLLEN